MKLSSVAALSVAGMTVASLAVVGLTGDETVAPTAAPLATPATAAATSEKSARDEFASQFLSGTTVRLEGRVGHPSIARGQSGETFVMLEAVGGKSAATERAAVNMSLVIDRSGSMVGTRLDNAIKAASGVVERLADGDVVNVISFDTETRVVVPSTKLDSANRDSVRRAISGISLGGDTCISCGIEHANRELARGASDRVNRIIVLSDGAATHGVRTIGGFDSIARQSRAKNVAISTVGVGVDYNQKILSALSFGSNGLHHFVENAASLPGVFAAEAKLASTTVASETEAEVTLGEGVELMEVIDRAHTRKDNRIVVPLGTLSPDDRRTVLMRVRVQPSAAKRQRIASVMLRYRDVAGGKAASCGGNLGVGVSDSMAVLDPLVSMRLQRSRTGSALLKANALFEAGKTDEALEVLRDNEEKLENERKGASAVAAKRKDTRGKFIDGDFARQQKSTRDARKRIKSKPKSTKGKAAVRRNREQAMPEMF